MKLNNLKVQELNAQEMKSIEGGFWGILAVAIFAVAALIFANDNNNDTSVWIEGNRVGY